MMHVGGILTQQRGETAPVQPGGTRYLRVGVHRVLTERAFS